MRYPMSAYSIPQEAVLSMMIRLDACIPAKQYLRTKPTLAQAWVDCDRADWMFWLAARLGIDRKELVRAACACARLGLPYIPSTEKLSFVALETAERWCDGGATGEEVFAARHAAAQSAGRTRMQFGVLAYHAMKAIELAADLVDTSPSWLMESAPYTSDRVFRLGIPHHKLTAIVRRIIPFSTIQKSFLAKLRKES